jgi:replicative DNA helicase
MASDPLTERLPPHSRTAEEHLIGGILHDPSVLDDVRRVVSADDLYFDAHQVLFRAIEGMVADGTPVELVALHERLKRAGHLDNVGGVKALVAWWEAVPTGANAWYHAKLIRDAADLRQLIHAANVISRNAYDRTGPAAELVAQAEQLVFDIRDRRGDTTGPRALTECVRDALEQIDRRAGGELAGLATGYADLDTVLAGLRPGQLVVIGARPGGGKTAIGLNVAVNIAVAATYGGAPTLFLSLEMPAVEIAGRVLAMSSGVPMHRFNKGERLAAGEIDALAAVNGPCGTGTAPMWIDDRCDLSAAEIASTLRRAKRKHGIGLAVVDYLQLLTPENPKDNRVQQVGTAARRLKQVARQTGVPVLCLCQLNREVENRAGGKPRLADLRESGEIEQHADAVILLHTPAGQPDDQPVWQIDAVVAKNRNGPVSDVPLAYKRPLMRFESMAKGPGAW